MTFQNPLGREILPQTAWERRLIELQRKPVLTPGEQVELDMLLQRKWREMAGR
jgi:hypothetical protein